ncbi:MAG: PilZ domain-containing protein [Deltaproteobacteria bacterium]|nr:PilZ domain-containing protein [Deltaproteobacteria bacterium]
MERRQHIRFYFSLPMEFQVQVSDSDESWESRAVLKNISQGGLYFECETAPQLKRGSVAEFTFTTEPPKYSFINSPIKAQAMVKRIEPRVAGSDNFGVAVQFLSGPLFG